MSRKCVKPSVDKKAFKITVDKGKTINIKRPTYRGGIRF